MTGEKIGVARKIISHNRGGFFNRGGGTITETAVDLISAIIENDVILGGRSRTETYRVAPVN
jgi:hypothetical protein